MRALLLPLLASVNLVVNSEMAESQRAQRAEDTRFAYLLLGLCFALFTGGSPTLAETSTTTSSAHGDHVSAESPDRTLFDIYVGDSQQGGVLVEYTEHWLEIENPQDAIDQLTEVAGKDGAELLPLLTGRIEGSRTIEGVGTVSFDIYTFRLLLTIDPAFLKSRTLNLTEHLPNPEQGFAFQQILGVAASGEVSGDVSSTFSHRSLFGSGRTFGRVNGAVVQGEDYDLTEVSAISYIGEFEGGAGFLETSGQSFANSLQFTGLRFRTSDEILLDPERSTGSRFEVFVPSRSRVEFYRNERLLSVQILDFGLQEVNTAAFPQGSYDVDVVIIDANGAITRERKFFAKSGFLSIRGRPSYDLQLGLLRDDFSTEDTEVYQAGVRFRAADSIDLGFSAYGSQDLSIGEVTLNALYLDNFLRIASSGSAEGDSGVSASLSGEIFGASFSLAADETFSTSDDSPTVAPTPTPLPGFPPEFTRPESRPNELRFQDRSSTTASIRRSIDSISIGYQAQREQFDDVPDRYSRGPTFEWRIFDGVTSSLRYTTSKFATEEGDVFSNVLNYRYRLSREWSLTSQLGYFDRDVESDSVAYLTVNYNEEGPSQNQNRLNLSSEVRKTNETVLTQQLLGEYGGDFVQGQAFLRQQDSDQSDSSTFGVNAQTAVLLSNDGAGAISAPPDREAVFIADIEGALGDTTFEILLNDQVYDQVQAGRRSAVGVEPFRTYRVFIRPVGDAELVDYDASTYVITFFPGNVVRKTFRAHTIYIALGRLVDPAGNPIAFQRIRGAKDYVATDEDGRFQMDVTGAERFFVESRDYNCQIELNVRERPQYFIDLGDVVCR